MEGGQRSQAYLRRGLYLSYKRALPKMRVEESLENVLEKRKKTMMLEGAKRQKKGESVFDRKGGTLKVFSTIKKEKRGMEEGGGSFRRTDTGIVSGGEEKDFRMS